ncbi:hypothetical protein [Limnohabitans sp. Bal53]|uniref:hypothetical protein n=1 Tax=Limnohabitans sp. Bal53 TaxID=1977910 RepID=UPI000D34B349|nr:hypothetical protein [Limnohabitans sp. Bal53]PUE41429.1 hypothetical protein B9Z50_06895 [Limnohabitans sp. Bal53]
MTQPQVSEQLPFDIRIALVKAAQISHPVQRIAAIEAAQALGRSHRPDLFQPVPLVEAIPCA